MSDPMQPINDAAAALNRVAARGGTFWDDADARVDQLEARTNSRIAALDEWEANAHPEKRYVQDITIEGGTDHFYPVWWGFPGDGHGMSRLQIVRRYSWNHPVLNTASHHQAGLLLGIEGAGHPHSGAANYLKVVKYSKTYRPTVSHLQFGMWAQPRYVAGADTSQPLQYPTPDTSYWNSGCYLRGGGLTYRFISNWVFEPQRLPDENDPNSEAIVFSIGNTESVVTRIPMTNGDGSSNLIEPVED